MLHVSDTLPLTVAQHAAKHIRSTLAERGVCHLALSGGTTPKSYLPALWQALEGIDADALRLYLVDERMVPPGHPAHNGDLITSLLPSWLPTSYLHTVDTLQPPVAAAEHYARQLPALLDMTLLGVGEDGHIASLFPDAAHWQDQGAAAAAFFVPRLQSWRVSLGLGTLLKSRHILVVAQGVAKTPMVARAVSTDGIKTLPVDWVRPHPPQITWFCDAAAAERVYR